MFLFSERKLTDLADVYVGFHNLIAVLEFTLEVEFACAAAVIDINHQRRPRHDHVCAQDVFFPIVGGSARSVKAKDGRLGFVDDLNLTVCRCCGVGACHGGEGDSRQQNKTLEHNEPYDSVEKIASACMYCRNSSGVTGQRIRMAWYCTIRKRFATSLKLGNLRPRLQIHYFQG